MKLRQCSSSSLTSLLVTRSLGGAITSRSSSNVVTVSANFMDSTGQARYRHGRFVRGCGARSPHAVPNVSQ